MNAKNTHKNPIGINPSLRERRRIPLALASAVTVMLLAFSAKAGNILVNPDFTGAAVFAAGSWSQHASETWSMAPASAADPTSDVLETNGGGLWMQGLYGNGQGGAQTSYAAQVFVFQETPIPRALCFPHIRCARAISVVMTAASAATSEVRVFMAPTAPATKTDGLKCCSLIQATYCLRITSQQ
jgi:hypothetical protein